MTPNTQPDNSTALCTSPYSAAPAAIDAPPTVLILGARGRFGLAAALAFADAGWRVLAHMRPGASVPTEVRGDPRLEWISLAVDQPASLARAAAGASIVVHALNPAYTNQAWLKQAPILLGDSIEVARALGATVMLPGNIYNFGPDMPSVLREETPQMAGTIKGQVRIAMEAQLQQSGVPGIVLRAGDFFGSGKGTWFDTSIVKDLQKGVFTYPGSMGICTAWAYLPDLARTFVQVAARRAQLSSFEVLHFAGYSLSVEQWLDVLTPIARAQGWIKPGSDLVFKRLPWAIIRIGAWFNATWAALIEMRYLWNAPHALANDKLVALLGAEPHTPLAQAAQTALADLGYLERPRSARRVPGVLVARGL